MSTPRQNGTRGNTSGATPHIDLVSTYNPYRAASTFFGGYKLPESSSERIFFLEGNTWKVLETEFPSFATGKNYLDLVRNTYFDVNIFGR